MSELFTCGMASSICSTKVSNISPSIHILYTPVHIQGEPYVSWEELIRVCRIVSRHVLVLYYVTGQYGNGAMKHVKGGVIHGQGLTYISRVHSEVTYCSMGGK